MSMKPRPTVTAGPTRRDLLLAGTAAAASTLIARPALAAMGGGSGYTMNLPGADELVPANMPRGFSRAEMERRWKKCREWMRKADFDALIVPTRPEGNADIKWLTENDPDWVVFPQSGRPTAIYRTEHDAAEMRASSKVDIDVLNNRYDRSKLVIDSMKKSGVSSGRIGVADLSGVLRDDEGGVSYTAMKNIMDALPRATFESAAELIMNVKLARGPEEIHALKLASRVSELGLKTLAENSRVGAENWELWFESFKSLLGGSGEIPGDLSIRSGGEANTSNGLPLREKFQDGQIMNQEISASVLGYNSQVNQSMCIGTPPKEWDTAFKYTLEVFDALLDWAKPGRSFKDYVEFYKTKMDDWVKAHGGKPYYNSVVFHTAGPLGDGPRMGWGRTRENDDRIIETGMVFTLKPRIPIPGVKTPNAQVGDAVLITETGAERLGVRKLETITLA